MEAPPLPKALLLLGEPLRPYRSTAAWYCWRAAASIPAVTRAKAAGQSRGSTITFPPEEGVISSSKTSGT